MKIDREEVWECGVNVFWKDLLKHYVSMFQIIWCISWFFEDCCFRSESRGLGQPYNLPKHVWFKPVCFWTN